MFNIFKKNNKIILDIIRKTKNINTNTNKVSKLLKKKKFDINTTIDKGVIYKVMKFLSFSLPAIV
jgi:hypothetical protein